MADAIIFDCDGVLINSEVICQRVELAALAEIGVAYQHDVYIERYLSDYHTRFGCEVPDDFPAVLLERIRKEAVQHLKPIPGVHQAIASFGVPVAVASGSSNAWLEKTLQQVGLFQLFAPHIYSAKQMPRGKPAPDIYLHACNQLGVSPNRCVAVEDSLMGVMSGVSAGMSVIGFVGGGHCSASQAARLKAAGAAHVIDHMDQLSSAVESFS
jgi:HAD superfamily hydrolase (TIGR01509 family)